VAEKIRAAVSHSVTRPGRFGGRLTVSIGVATVESPGVSSTTPTRRSTPRRLGGGTRSVSPARDKPRRRRRGSRYSRRVRWTQPESFPACTFIQSP
jgi:hypothetical protein